jgi:hypothetical protein
MNQTQKSEPQLEALIKSTKSDMAGSEATKPVPFTGNISSCDVPYERYHGPQAYAVTFVLGGSTALDEGNERALLESEVLYVIAHNRMEAIELGRRALQTRADGHFEYTVVGVYYIDQLLWFVQGAYRTLAGISLPTDPSNSDDPPHEYFKPYSE